MTSKISPKYDSTLQWKLKESEEQLKTIINSNNPNFDIFFELDNRFNEIALMLEKCEVLQDELDYFLGTSDKILYIIYKNCKNNLFGHYDFALELFDLFIEIWNAKIRLINHFSKEELEKYEEFKNNFKSRYEDYRHEFYLEIYESGNEFSKKEMYEIHKSLRTWF